MSEQNDIMEPTAQEPQTPAAVQPAVAQAEPQTGGREARYRIRAKQAEEERDRLHGLLTDTRRRILTSLSEQSGLDPNAARDVFTGLDAEQVDGLFTETGEVDNDGLNSFVAQQIEEHPYYRSAPRSKASPMPNQSSTPNIDPLHQVGGWNESFGRV